MKKKKKKKKERKKEEDDKINVKNTLTKKLYLKFL